MSTRVERVDCCGAAHTVTVEQDDGEDSVPLVILHDHDAGEIEAEMAVAELEGKHCGCFDFLVGLTLGDRFHVSSGDRLAQWEVTAEYDPF